MENRGSYMAVQLLNVPQATPGDRSTWTWASNWKNYVVAGAFSGSTNAQSFISQGASPDVNIDLILPANQPLPGAYYDGLSYDDDRYVAIYNNTGTAITYTHAAVFTNQNQQATFDPNASLLEESLAVVIPVNPETEASATLNAFTTKLFPCSIESANGGTVIGFGPSFTTWGETFFIDEPLFPYTSPAPFTIANSLILNSALFNVVATAYFQNTPTKAYLVDTYKSILGVSNTTPTPTFLGELLNVTGSEPDFDEGWSGWSSYRINRYSMAVPEQKYQYAAEEVDGTTFLGPDEFYLSLTGTTTSLKSNTEFVFTPPASSSFTYTHIAVFVNAVSAQPANGTSYTYTDTDKFLGVIKLDSSVTLTSSSVARAYPFNLSFMFQPRLYAEELGS